MKKFDAISILFIILFSAIAIVATYVVVFCGATHHILTVGISAVMVALFVADRDSENPQK